MTPTTPAPKVEKPTRPWSNSYIRLLAVGVMCSVIVTGLLDYQLKVEAQHLYPTKHELAQFFGGFYIALNLGALVVQLLVTPWALQTLGAIDSALVLPAGVGIGAAFMLGAPGVLSVLGTRWWTR